MHGKFVKIEKILDINIYNDAEKHEIVFCGN